MFRGKISKKTRAYACYVRTEGPLSYREISKKCSLSVSSAVRICTEGTDAQGHKKRTGRPPIMSRRDRSDLQEHSRS